MLSFRFVLALVLVFSFAFSAQAQTTTGGDPGTTCTPVTIDAFGVTASGGESSTELATVTGTFGKYNYFVDINPGYGPTPPFSNIFFNVILISSNPPSGTTATFYINATLNGQSKTATDSAAINENVMFEFSNWLSSNKPVNNTLLLNVTEIVLSTTNPSGSAPDFVECGAFFTIIFQNEQPTPTGAFITGDPQFVGLRGQSFQVHGVDGAVYNLISDKSMSLNSRFRFLEGPRPCPVMPSTGKLSSACWSHPGSYLSELGLLTVGGSKLHIVSGPAATGFKSITLNGKPLLSGSTASLDFGTSGLSGSISVDNSHELTIAAGHFNLVIENNDHFVNLRHVSVPATSWSKLQSHGLLGQTWQNKRYNGKIKDIEGDVDDYLIEDDALFGTQFVYNKYNQ